MQISAIFLLVSVALCSHYEDRYQEMLGHLMKNRNIFLKWEHGINKRFQKFSREILDMFYGSRRDYFQQPLLPTPDDFSEEIEMPEFFDARKKWSVCKWMGFIRDQSNCGSCWAVSSAAVMSDRHCVFSDGKFQPYISDENILSCCHTCGRGCLYGYPFLAFEYWIKKGVPTGSPQNYSEGCQPYLIDCDECTINARTPRCLHKCYGDPLLNYKKDKFYGKTGDMKLPLIYVKGRRAYAMMGMNRMMQDIYQHGPIVAVLESYEDLRYYKKGINMYVSYKWMQVCH
ncbi:unnamed protein product [Soboliphyme baturini]|uniref:Pept_C1 domain-containing protein n=1 Tax=Soboliphyme baturini TaxID=241478 RepID=A0A183J2T1_9BILA|nr:unnamed protein product [Soboliphyme baturini]